MNDSSLNPIFLFPSGRPTSILSFKTVFHRDQETRREYFHRKFNPPLDPFNRTTFIDIDGKNKNNGSNYRLPNEFSFPHERQRLEFPLRSNKPTKIERREGKIKDQPSPLKAFFWDLGNRRCRRMKEGWKCFLNCSLWSELQSVTSWQYFIYSILYYR